MRFPLNKDGGKSSDVRTSGKRYNENFDKIDWVSQIPNNEIDDEGCGCEDCDCSKENNNADS